MRLGKVTQSDPLMVRLNGDTVAQPAVGPAGMTVGVEVAVDTVEGRRFVTYAPGATVTRYEPANADTLPRSYPEGFSRSFFATGSPGLPDGGYFLVTTDRSAFDVSQTLNNIVGHGIWRRFSFSSGNFWSAWSQLAQNIGYPADTVWRSVASTGNGVDGYFGSFFANYGGDGGSPGVPLQYRRLANGMVVMRGRTFWNGTGANPVTVVAPGYRPQIHHRALVANGGAGTNCQLVIWNDGAVHLNNAVGNTWHDMFTTWYADI